ncbi:Calcium-binding protein CML42 [Bienertia sinuspersici]
MEGRSRAATPAFEAAEAATLAALHSSLSNTFFYACMGNNNLEDDVVVVDDEKEHVEFDLNEAFKVLIQMEMDTSQR